jgi:alpha-tubulin suppressor-like RCC1 family protein
MKVNRLYVRGYNFLGQCGLGKKIPYTNDEFIPLTTLPYDIKSVQSNYGSNFLLAEDNKTLYYFGFNWDLRSFIRTTAAYQSFPFLVNLIKKVWPTFKTFPYSPSILNEFKTEIIKYDVGASFGLVLDKEGSVYSIGDNYWDQIGVGIYNCNIAYDFQKLKFNKDSKVDNDVVITNISAGFQHSLFLDSNQNIYGCGKCSRHQLGHIVNSKESTGIQILKINGSQFDGRVVDIKAGKYHSLFLTDKGYAYAIGNNRFGQLGLNSTYEMFSDNIVKIEFDSDVLITKIEAGDNHSLYLSKDGRLFANGDNTQGQLNGITENITHFICNPTEVFHDSIDKIIDIKSKNLKSIAIFESGKVAYWGGLYYQPNYRLNKLPKINGINYYNDEKGLENKKIIDVGLGLLHELVLVEEELSNL